MRRNEEKMILKINKVWFQNRRAKLNRKRAQEKNTGQFYHWPSYNKEHEHSSSASSSSQSSVTSSPTTLYSQISPQMRPIDILALAAEYVQRCDEEEKRSEGKLWRPWD